MGPTVAPPVGRLLITKTAGTLVMIKGHLQPLCPQPQMWQLQLPQRQRLLRLSSMQLSAHQRLPPIVELRQEILHQQVQPPPLWDSPKICSHNTSHLHYLPVRIEKKTKNNNNLIVPP